MNPDDMDKSAEIQRGEKEGAEKMTTIRRIPIQCPVCGNTWESPVIKSTNAFGSMDLDTRPPEMRRSTMCYWLQECHECGYVATDMDEDPPIDKAFLTQEKYTTCDGYSFENSMAGTFYKHHLIMLEAKKVLPAIHSLLHAAWVCDDEGDNNAVILRTKLADIMEEYLKSNYDTSLDIMRADALRRSRQFKKLIKEYEGKEYSEELLSTILNYELSLAREEDDRCYTVSDAVAAMEQR